MFFVFNKEKIYTYLVSIMTVILLFFTTSNVDFFKEKIIDTSSSTEKLLPIYKVKTEENKIALTMNCAWNADDIDEILDILKQNDVKITFFVVGDWIDRYPEYLKKISDEGHEIRKS